MSMSGFGAVYVGDLNPEVTEANLYQIFNSLGPVASVRVCRDAASRRSLGYAYVNYHQAEHAEKAIDTFNGYKVNNRPCRVMMSQRDPALRKSQQGNVFVKGLHESVDIKDLHDFFSTYGNILSCKVVTDKAGKSLGYGFVHFEKEEDARKAVATQSEGRELQIKNKKIEVMPFVPKKKRAPGSAGLVPSSETKDLWIASLHIEVSPSEVKQLFNQKAKIEVDDKNVSIRAPREGAKFTVNECTPDGNIAPRSVVVTADKPSPVAYAIVECNNRKDAQAGLEGTDQQPYRNFVLRVDWRKSKFELEKLKEQRRLERQQRNLFVRNLPTSWDEARLKAEFEPYGVVESWLLDEKHGKSQDLRKAYVCMQTKEQAERAIQALNGRRIEDAELSVVLHIPREIQKRGDFSPAQQASNVYVKNIPASWTLESFQREFSKYGKISSARLATENGKHRGFGFVAFTTPQEAMNAISGAHGQQVEEGKQPLYVQLFQRKEQRQQQQAASRQLPGPPAAAPGYPPYPRGFMYPPAFRAAARYPVQYPPYYRLQEQMQQLAYYPMAAAAAPRFHLQPAQAARPPTEAQRQQFIQQQQQQQARARVGLEQAQQRRRPQPVARRVNPTQLQQLTPQEQKQYLGEHLFQKIAVRKPNLAGKITGMLLEMKNDEIISILENDEMLNNRVDEAVEVLDRAGLEVDSQ